MQVQVQQVLVRVLHHRLALRAWRRPRMSDRVKHQLKEEEEEEEEATCVEKMRMRAQMFPRETEMS